MNRGVIVFLFIVFLVFYTSKTLMDAVSLTSVGNVVHFLLCFAALLLAIKLSER